MRSPRWLAALIAMSLPLPAWAQVEPETLERFDLPRLTTAPRVDGVVEATEWEGATSLQLRFETEPTVNGPARVGTRCSLARTHDRLYMACRAEDPRPGDIRAQYLDRDQAGSDDRVVLYLDPFGDGQQAYVFSVTALGVQSDGVFDQGRGNVDASWNAIWESAGRITESGFDIEISIPFNSIRFPPPDQGSGAWRFYIERSWPRTERRTMASVAYNPNDSCRLCYAQQLVAGVVEKAPVALDAIPTFTMARTERRVVRDAPFTGSGAGTDVGLDLRWNVSSQAAINVTFNPDFSQVEADALQFVTNTRFALFVPERRPFFLEAAEIFQSPLRAVFTRSIGDPSLGAKVTGRSGAWSGGSLYARDATTNLLLPGSARSTLAVLDGPSDAWVGRVTRTLGSGANVVGALLTHRSARDYENSVAGFDAFVRPLRALEVRGQVLRSTTSYPDQVGSASLPAGVRFSDHAAQIDARYSTRKWTAQGRVEAIGDAFRADLGFIPQVDSRRVEGSVTRRIWGDGVPWLTQAFASLGYWRLHTEGGELKERGFWSQAVYEGPFQTRFAVNPFWMTERFAGKEFPRYGINVTAAISPGDDFVMELRTRGTRVIDYANARLAWERVYIADTGFRLGRRISLDVSANSRTMRHEGAVVNREGILRLRSRIGLSVHTFLSGLVQTRSLELNGVELGEAIQQASTTVETQLFLTHRRNGQTAFLFGYSDLLTGPDGMTIGGLQRQSLTWFFKVSYAWRP